MAVTSRTCSSPGVSMGSSALEGMVHKEAGAAAPCGVAAAVPWVGVWVPGAGVGLERSWNSTVLTATSRLRQMPGGAAAAAEQ